MYKGQRVPNRSLEDRIKGLAAEAVAAEDPAQLADIVRKLRAALHEHYSRLRKMAAEKLLLIPEKASVTDERAAGIDLKKALRDKRSRQERAWGKIGESDEHKNEASQPYANRESNSAEGFADGLKLANPKNKDSGKKTD